MECSPTIQAIDKKSVHHICSGQVILDLATAVKELVENSLDAGADNIEIKTKEYGKESIEVTDNGSGIEEKNFETLALKHYTSKLREFNDLTFVDTFGFRGEALSSLCALSNVVVTTRHKTVDFASKLDFDHNGKLNKHSRNARTFGTTVSVDSIFCTLPVRHKEFHRNYKKEFVKLMHVMYAYSLINCHVRFSCLNIVSKKKNQLLSTNGKKQVVDIIASIFGPKQSKDIVRIQHGSMTDDILQEFDISESLVKDFGNQFSVAGYVSKVTHGCGRSSPDRQFFFINRRPCDFPKLSRVVNGIYHQFNRNQYPFVFLDISLRKDCIDVNVTPDKRQIMIQQEKLLFALVKNSLKVTFDNCATIFEENMENVPSSFDSQLNGEKLLSIARENVLIQPSPVLSPLERFRSKFDRPAEKTVDLKCEKNIEQYKLDDFFQMKEKKRKFCDTENKLKPMKKCIISLEGKLNSAVDQPVNLCDEKTVDLELKSREVAHVSVLSELVKEEVPEEAKEIYGNNEKTFDLSESGFDSVSVKQEEDDKESLEENLACQISPNFQCNKDVTEMDSVNIIVEHDRTNGGENSRKRIVTAFDMEVLKARYNAYMLKINKQDYGTMDLPEFHAKIAPNDNKSAEEELQKHVSKEMFPKMTIVGQFNLGFIITKLKNDLFIVDQHATDEKYNFEMLQKKHCLKGQKLIQPIPLELTFMNKSILLDNIEIFKQNGFDFDEPQNCEESVKLTKVPASRNWTFSVSDVEELIFMLSDSPGLMCRPSRVRQMFASRACRSSIMVGTALDTQTMRKLLNHMSELEHPWNCPHGRPTMRHLISLQRLSV